MVATDENTLTASLPRLAAPGGTPSPCPSAESSQVIRTACPEALETGSVRKRPMATKCCSHLSQESVQVGGKWPLAGFLADSRGLTMSGRKLEARS